jgi:hypothetical protein
MPQIRSKQILGSTPIKPTDLATKEYVDNLVISGGTGGGAINIEDEGTLVLSGATILNFIGINVKAQSALSGTTRRVNVYIPPPAYVSHFNSSDGTSNASVSPISTTDRYIALPDSPGTPYDIGTWSGGEIHNTIRNSTSTISYSPVGDFSIYDLTTTFTATVYGTDGITPLATYTVPLNGDNTTTSNNITIVVSNFSTDADRYKADITVNINIGSILAQGGRFSVLLRHDNSTDGTYTFTQNNIFRDIETLTAGVTGSLTVEEQTPVIKQISGVYYYDYGSQWHVNLPNINNLNSRSYPTTQQVRIEDNDLIFTSTVLDIHGEGGSYNTFEIGTWTQQHDTTGAEYDKTDWTTNQNNQTNWNHTIGDIDTPQATGTVYDWGVITTVNSSTYNYLIDTFVDTSDRNSEMFRTETNPSYPRLQSDLSTPWDNTLSLNSVDSGNGLQVLADRLVYPKYDFSLYEPQSTTQPSYVGYSGDKYYYRAFETNGDGVSNGVIQFSEHSLTEADLSNVEFEISIDSEASWYTLNSPYIGGPLSNGSGCRVDNLEYGLGTGTVNSNSLKFTLGTGGSSTYVFLKITFNSSASDEYIGGIDFIEGNWV